MKARENPYRSEQVLQIRYLFGKGSIDDVLHRLQQLRYRAAIVGPEGSGKTTLLEDLQEPLLSRGKQLHWFRLTRENPHFGPAQQQRLRQPFNGKDILLFDGAEILGWPRFQLFRWQIRTAGGLIITTHQAGYLPTLLETKTSPQLLSQVLSILDPSASHADAGALFQRHRGNLREALRDRYDCRMNTP